MLPTQAGTVSPKQCLGILTRTSQILNFPWSESLLWVKALKTPVKYVIERPWILRHHPSLTSLGDFIRVASESPHSLRGQGRAAEFQWEERGQVHSLGAKAGVESTDRDVGDKKNKISQGTLRYNSEPARPP